MTRMIEYDPFLTCDFCGKKGAYDLNGDYICYRCMSKCKICGYLYLIDDGEDGICADCMAKIAMAEEGLDGGGA